MSAAGPSGPISNLRPSRNGVAVMNHSDQVVRVRC